VSSGASVRSTRCGHLAAHRLVLRRFDRVAHHEIAQRALLVLAGRLVEWGRQPRRLDQQADLVGRDVQPLGELAFGRLARFAAAERPALALDLAERLHHVHGQPDRTAVVGHPRPIDWRIHHVA
jgi:hypothetical protein